MSGVLHCFAVLADLRLDDPAGRDDGQLALRGGLWLSGVKSPSVASFLKKIVDIEWLTSVTNQPVIEKLLLPAG